MLRDARSKDKEEVKELWKISMHKRLSEIDYFFSDVYSSGKTIVSEQDNRVVSSLFFKEHSMHFGNHYLLVSQICGVATLPDYRRRGHMDRLMHSCLEETEKKHFITLIQAYNPRLYERYGFEMIYERKVYEILKTYLGNISVQRFSETVSAKECLEVYEQFCKYFDGYYQRDIQYFEDMIKKAKKLNDTVCAYFTPEGKIQGYAYIQNLGKEKKISEIIYLDSLSLKKMIRYAIGMNHSIQVEVTSAEKIEKIFDLAIGKKVPYMMAKINNYALFNKLFDCKVKSCSDAFKILKKHLFLHEDY